jgi:hypothetical protein
VPILDAGQNTRHGQALRGQLVIAGTPFGDDGVETLALIDHRVPSAGNRLQLKEIVIDARYDVNS